MEIDNQQPSLIGGDDLEEPTQQRGANDVSKEELISTMYQLRMLVHDASQPLTTILTLLDLLRMEDDLKNASIEDIRLIFTEAIALRNILQSIGRKLHQKLPSDFN